MAVLRCMRLIITELGTGWQDGTCLSAPRIWSTPQILYSNEWECGIQSNFDAGLAIHKLQMEKTLIWLINQVRHWLIPLLHQNPGSGPGFWTRNNSWSDPVCTALRPGSALFYTELGSILLFPMDVIIKGTTHSTNRHLSALPGVK